MKEIGGYLEFESLIHNAYYKNAIALNLARNALIYLAKAKNIKKVYLPYFLCDSVSIACDNNKIPYEFYHIDKHFHPVLDNQPNEHEYLYIVNYYGQLDEITIQGYKEQYQNIIVDNVQAFFAAPVANVDTLYSCRKFFGVPDGAYLITDAPTQTLLADNSCERAKHIFGRYDSGNASDYYNDFRFNEDKFEKLPLMGMSKSTHNIMGAIDYQTAIRKRTENWQHLHNGLKSKNALNLKHHQGPYMYPFYCDNAIEIRSKMAQKKIYIPLLWPNVKYTNASDYEKNLASNILPLPVDQRYDVYDMNRLLEELFQFL